jgi:hypothetical protein
MTDDIDELRTVDEIFDEIVEQSRTTKAEALEIHRKSPESYWTFRVGGKEREAMIDFMAEHDEQHSTYSGAIGGRYTYSFMPTSIGTAVGIKCSSCNEGRNVTAFDEW